MTAVSAAEPSPARVILCRRRISGSDNPNPPAVRLACRNRRRLLRQLPESCRSRLALIGTSACGGSPRGMPRGAASVLHLLDQTVHLLGDPVLDIARPAIRRTAVFVQVGAPL